MTDTPGREDLVHYWLEKSDLALASAERERAAGYPPGQRHGLSHSRKMGALLLRATEKHATETSPHMLLRCA